MKFVGLVVVLSQFWEHETSAFSPSAFRGDISSRILSPHTVFGKLSAENSESGIFFDKSTDFNDFVSDSTKIALTQKPDQPEKQPFDSNYSIRNRSVAQKDVLIIGGGLAGLSTALHIALNSGMTERRYVTVVEREHFSSQRIQTSAASFAAAGMLAPQSERLPTGPLLDLCLASRNMYADFCSTVEDLASTCHSDAAKYLWQTDDSGKPGELKPWEVGFTAAGGFLAPAFAGDTVATWAPPEGSGTAHWLDEIQVHELEPHLHPDVIGGWWFPEDASVDARRLTCSLRAACVEAGVQFLSGEEYAATSLEISGGKCHGVRLKSGKLFSAKSVVVANGSWMRELLPVPVTPHKGQSFSLRMPTDKPPLLSRVLFAQDTYIVPKADGKIVIGATVEAGSFDPNVTPSGLMHCMSNAIQLVPGLADLSLEETWAGLRPTTPDKGPILGNTNWADNLYIAGGYWRNGVLLAPKTGQLIGDLITQKPLSTQDLALLEAFSWDRFTKRGGGKALAANTRYAASMHPVHRRSEGMGVAAAVGTELGFYSTASSAKEERARDRQSILSNDTDSMDAAFEKAAKLGIADAESFSKDTPATFKKLYKEKQIYDFDETAGLGTAMSYDGSVDALTVGVSSNLNRGIISATEVSKASKASEDTKKNNSRTISLDYDETTFDGYTVIEAANKRNTRDEELAAMKEARMANRVKASEIEDSAIGAKKISEKIDFDSIDSETPTSTTTEQLISLKNSELDELYAKIKANKASASVSTSSNSLDLKDSKPDPGFRIYHIDDETGEKRLIPPFSSPQDIDNLISKKG